MDQPSSSESEIIDILNRHNIFFEREKIFSGLKGVTNNSSLPVDFAININGFLAIIEYNGAQHYRPINNTPSAIAAWRRLTKNGSARIKFATQNNIPLLVIHYKDRKAMKHLIPKFIEDIKFNIHDTKPRYTKNTKAYFAAFPYYNFDKTDDSPEAPVNPLKMEKIEELGCFNIDHAILWTQEGLETMMAREENYKSEIEQYKSVTSELVMHIHELEEQVEQQSELIQSLTEPVSESKKDSKSQAVNQNLPDFIGRFRLNDSPRSRLTDDAKTFIRLLSSQYSNDLFEIHRFLKINYDENISVPTIKKCVS
ncbi:hypothetical protein [Companilactobacillus insicii]|uniref:hypothetical protein n=1 Tax=Companilactobacillus insicii TaxID=1732567 RepID=UPI000F7B3513|nr:hypothetical protein [Companilactobacillus insicii]